MKSIAEFTKTTLIGGVLVVLPVYLTTLLLLKALSAMVALISPVTATLPAELQFRQVFAALIAIGACFVAGLVVRTGPGLRVKNAFERGVLQRVPGYALVRGLAGRVAGRQDDEMLAIALIEIEEALVPGFVVEEHDDGRYTVFVPSVPTPAAGSLYIIARERVHLCDLPFSQAIGVITRWGTGSRALLAAMRPPPPAKTAGPAA